MCMCVYWIYSLYMERISTNVFHLLQTQQSSDRRATHKRLQILTEKVSLLNVQLSTTSEKLRETENHLASVEQEKRNLQQKLS